MNSFLSVLIHFLCCAAIALYFILKPGLEDRKIRKGVNNSDTMTRSYVFLLRTDAQEAINKLLIPNVNDPLLYSFDPEALTITFSEYNVWIKYNLSFYVIDHTTYLKVSRVHFLFPKSYIPYKINAFFIQKLDAAPVVYSHFETLLKNTPH